MPPSVWAGGLSCEPSRHLLTRFRRFADEMGASSTDYRNPIFGTRHLLVKDLHCGYRLLVWCDARALRRQRHDDTTPTPRLLRAQPEVTTGRDASVRTPAEAALTFLAYPEPTTR